ncbi:MAG: NCS2 family permease [Candidatus Eisenbacteria bacterium]|nr:NCS2 family permease [Candidatus Eisenbacteria bacterium]
MIESIFHVRASGSTVRREAFAGLTTFLTMAYIIFLNPAILSMAGMDFGSVMVATCLVAAFGTLMMAFLANYPIALAPGMGENFFLVTAVLGMGITWQQGLGAVFLAGFIFLILSILRVREMILDGVPDPLKHGIAAGIGLFIVLMGLVNGGIVVRHPIGPVVPVALGDLRGPAVQTALSGLLVTAVLAARRLPGAILIGMVATAVFGLIRGVVQYEGIVGPPPSLRPTFLQMDLGSLLDPALWPVVLIFLFMGAFDAIGTLIGVGQQGGFLKEGKLPKATRALCTDAAASMVGAALGTSDVTEYVESAAGVQAGGRTGLANVVTAGLFFFAIFLGPLVEMIGGGYEIAKGALLYPVTAPALILVGCLMARGFAHIPWDDPAPAIPAFLIAVGIPLTYSIAEGLAFGFISYPIVMLLAGRGREVKPLAYVLGVLFLLRYVLLAK